eukprot:CAMPEP_0176491160 /NCGR_PEP_ID=MMETSP0200_2-20121128/8278_1 /TAXON_ID=947934 /ORGANISM="Chaetoceros sp., Strain GSL56" /LENGTH=370 /DNA_ID=CAMNT_0017888559 /DNA_START=43 /DNA_END=1152 /DNA_ORIENTATION=+
MTHSNTDTDNEWTFVTRKKKTGRRHDVTPTSSNQNYSQNKKDRQKVVAQQAIHLQSSILLHESSSHDDSHSKDSLEAMIAIIEKCKLEMKSSWFGNKQCCSTVSGSSSCPKIFDMTTILKTIKEACTIYDGHSERSRQVCEIICYGIGNFSHARSNKYNAPLIQLVCVLILRENFATAQRNRRRTDHGAAEENYSYLDGMISSSSSCAFDVNHDDTKQPNVKELSSNHQQQELVPIYYYEPLINPLEGKVLRYFNINVMDVNEQGKHCIQKENTDNHHEEKETDFCTLFYMPHCPMRLYSNVLWANWREDLILNGRIIIFGNSFNAYDDRIISSHEKHDNTNAIFPLLPFLSEVPVLITPKTKNNNGKKW